MEKYYQIALFDAIYIIDLCESLLQVARQRCKQNGWKNVIVLCQDAAEFSLPEWSHGVDTKGSVGFVTLSYSLSMVCLRPSQLFRILHAAVRSRIFTC